MKKVLSATVSAAILITSLLIILGSCSNHHNDMPASMPMSVPSFPSPPSPPTRGHFEQNLSTYNIYQGNMQDIIPTAGFHLLEVSAPLFTDYAEKQRLVKIPSGKQMTMSGGGIPNFPDGSVLVKTFYYYKDLRDTSLGKKIVETRLLIKTNGVWNAATYVWNNAQTDATLSLDGLDMSVSWITAAGNNQSIRYHAPSENECFACHQSNSVFVPLGPTLRNLNNRVTRNNARLNQLTYLQSIGIINSFDVNQITSIVDYSDPTVSSSKRGRAYLDMNCAHCHNPSGWKEGAKKGYDFRYETPIDQTGIRGGRNVIMYQVSHGMMPYLGTTTLDREGVSLIAQYIRSL